MQAVSVNKNHWGFTFKPFFDGTDLAIHNANLSKAGRTYFDFILTKLDGKRRNLMTIPFSDTEFAQRFNYSESRARHARLEVVDAQLAEQHFGRTKSGHRIVGKFCFKLVLPNTDDTPSPPITPESLPASPPQQSPPDEPPVSAKVAESQPEKWLEVSHKSGQELATFSQAKSYSKPVIARFASDDTQVAIDVPIDICINVPPPISPSNVEMLSLAWNESHGYEEGEEEEFDKYFDKAIRATMAQHAVDENVATAALARAFYRTKHNHAGHHPYDYPTAYTGDPDHSESNATPRGKKILQGAIHAVKAGQSFVPKPHSSSDHPSNNPTHNDIEPATIDSDKCSAASVDKDGDKHVQEACDAVVSSDEGCSTQSPNHARTTAEINAELLATWDDDRWLAWVSEHVDKCVRIRQMLCGSPVGEDLSPYTDAEIETMRDELLAKYPETDEQRFEWIGKRIRERESQRTSAQPENTTKPERETVSYHQQGYNTPQAYVDAYCKKQAHRRNLSGVEVTRLFRESEGQVSPDEIERNHACEHQNFLWEQKNDQWAAVV